MALSQKPPNDGGGENERVGRETRRRETEADPRIKSSYNEALVLIFLKHLFYVPAGLWQTTLMKGRDRAPEGMNLHLTHSGRVSSSQFSESEPSWAKWLRFTMQAGLPFRPHNESQILVLAQSHAAGSYNSYGALIGGPTEDVGS